MEYLYIYLRKKPNKEKHHETLSFHFMPFYFELSNLYEFDYNTIDYMLKYLLTNQNIDNFDI